MLSRDICRSCLIAKYGYQPSPSLSLDDASHWYCVILKVMTSFNDVPPLGCLRMLEHAVAESVNIDTTGGADVDNRRGRVDKL